MDPFTSTSGVERAPPRTAQTLALLFAQTIQRGIASNQVSSSAPTSSPNPASNANSSANHVQGPHNIPFSSTSSLSAAADVAHALGREALRSVSAACALTADSRNMRSPTGEGLTPDEIGRQRLGEASCQAADVIRYMESRRLALLSDLMCAANVVEGALAEEAGDAERNALRLGELTREEARLDAKLAELTGKTRGASLIAVAELRARLDGVRRERIALAGSSSAQTNAESQRMAAAAMTAGAAEMLQAIQDFFSAGYLATKDLTDNINQFREYSRRQFPETAMFRQGDASVQEVDGLDDHTVVIEDASSEDDNENDDDDDGIGNEIEEEETFGDGDSSAQASAHLPSVDFRSKLVRAAQILASDENRELIHLRVVCDHYRKSILEDPTLFTHLKKDEADAIFGNARALLSAHERCAEGINSAVAVLRSVDHADNSKFVSALQLMMNACAAMLRSLPALYTTYVANYSSQMLTLNRCQSASAKFSEKLAAIQHDCMETTPLDLATLLTTPLNHVSKVKAQVHVLRESFLDLGPVDGQRQVLDLLQFCKDQCFELGLVVEQGLSQYHVSAARSLIEWPNVTEIISALEGELTSHHDLTRSSADNEMQRSFDALCYVREIAMLLTPAAWTSRTMVLSGACDRVSVRSPTDEHYSAKRLVKMLSNLSGYNCAYDAHVGGYRVLAGDSPGSISVFSDMLLITTRRSKKADGARKLDQVSQQLVCCLNLHLIRRVKDTASRQGDRRTVGISLALPGASPTKTVDIFIRLESPSLRRKFRRSIAAAVRAARQQDLFGVSLPTLMLGSRAAYRKSGDRGEIDVPPVIEELTSCLEQPSHINEEGIFRLSALSRQMNAVREQLDRLFAIETGSRSHGEIAKLTVATHTLLRSEIRVILDKQDTHTICGCLKMWLRMLPSPLLTFSLYDRWILLGADIEKSASNRLPTPRTDSDNLDRSEKWRQEAKRLINSLPWYNRCTLQHLFGFLANVAAHSASNRMNARNLAIVFVPLLLRSKSAGFGNDGTSSFVRAAMNDLAAQQKACSVIQLFIENYAEVFASVLAERRKNKLEQKASKQQTMRAKRQQRVLGGNAHVQECSDDEALDIVDRRASDVPMAGHGETLKSDPRAVAVLTLRLEDIVKQGTLSKKGAVRKNWKRRWIVLKRGTLFYFANASDETPKGLLDLTNCRVQPRYNRSARVRPFQFVVSTPQRDFAMAAENEASADAWIASIKDASPAEYRLP